MRELQDELNSTINVLDEVRDPGSPRRISDKHVLQLFLPQWSPVNLPPAQTTTSSRGC
ncbi:hypothetical protein GCM10010460_19120 [Microbacterium terrae]